MNLVVVVAQASAAFHRVSLLGERGMHRYPPWTVVFYALVFAALSWNILQPPFAFLSAGHDARDGHTCLMSQCRARCSASAVSLFLRGRSPAVHAGLHHLHL